MTSSKVVLLSVVLSVAASALTTTLLFPSTDRARSAQQAAESHANAYPVAGEWLPIGAAPNADAIAQLQDKVRGIEHRLAAAGSARPARTKEAALQDLLAITQGERQIAIEDSLEELSALGNDIVPDIVALLKSGRDQDWGGGFSYGGNKVTGYPRLRTLLIDVLRQIGTPEAQEGLLDALGGSEDPLDYRDAFLLYGTTTDERMVRGISAMVPDALRVAKGQEGFTAECVTEWISRHGLKDTTDLVEEIARENLASGAYDRGMMGTLVGLAPERAFNLTREMRETGGESAFARAVSAAAGRGKAPLAQVARYFEMVLSLDLSESNRIALYASIPTRPCRSIETAASRTADAKVLADFLATRVRDEASPKAKQILEHYLAMLEGSLKK